MDINHTIELIVSAFELAGVAVLVIGSILAFVRSIVSLIRLRDGPAAYRHLRLYLGRSILSLNNLFCELAGGNQPADKLKATIIHLFHVSALFSSIST